MVTISLKVSMCRDIIANSLDANTGQHLEDLRLTLGSLCIMTVSLLYVPHTYLTILG